MARYIDVEKVHIPKGFFKDLNVPKLLNWLKSQPTADVVEVVRCKECVFWDVEKTGLVDECVCKMHSVVKVHSRYTNPTDYCSYGERKCEDGK